MIPTTELLELSGKRVDLDANVFIYAVEAFETYRAVSTELSVAIDVRLMNAVTNELTIAEVLVQPLAKSSLNIKAAYEHLMKQRPRFEVVPVNSAVLRHGAQIRATLGNKLPDAIHIAAAELANCSVLLSEDRAQKVPVSIRHLTLAELLAPSRTSKV